MSNSKHSKLSYAVVAAMTGSFGSHIAYAQTEVAQADNSRIEEVVVTATKRAASTQDIPVAVNALSSRALDELNVDSFDDVLLSIPGVTAGSSGPGQAQIYIRGLASTTPNLTTAGVAGLAPNVALYLDEQPLAQPGRNLDVYAVDLQRVEVLPGPQGTLFGASSQAGTVRLITNKPILGQFEAYANAGLSFTKGGEMSNKAEAVVNVPVSDNFALRGVFYADEQGGYIDNVAGTRTAADSARFREAGTVRANGVPVSENRQGFQADADLSGVTFLNADNSGLVEENFNDTSYQGFRLSGLWAITPDWSLTVMHARQEIESDGVFFVDPELDDSLAIQRFEQDELDDQFSTTSWTLEGRLAGLDIVYTGAYTDRDTDQRVDYTDYLFVGQYLPYYICDTAVVYPGSVDNPPADPTGTCQPPNLFVNSSTDTEVFTQELRFNTPETYRLRLTAGAFYSDLTLDELNDFTYPGSTRVRGADGVTTGFLPNFPLTNAAATPGERGNESQGYFSDAGPFPAGVIFRNDVRRTDEQFGIFGEATFDVNDQISLVFGARYYDVEVDLQGSANSSFFNLNSPVFGPNAGVPAAERVDAQLGGTNISAQYAPDNTVGAPDAAKTDGVIFKGTVNYRPNSNILLYATYSEGFRPGLLNRPGGAEGPNGFSVPFALDTDNVENYELGWKMDIFDNQVRFNGNAFFVDISDLQTTIFDPSITNLFFSDNAANAEIYGVEGNISYYPQAIPGLTVLGSFSFLDTEITEVLTPTDDVIEGEELAFAPDFQFTLRARYEWDVFDGDYRAHVQPSMTYSASQFTDIIEINKIQLENYALLNFATGIRGERWNAEVYVDNITDKRAQVSGNFVFDRSRVIVARPLTVGLRVGFQY